jgi:hypothetical protein
MTNIIGREDHPVCSPSRIVKISLDADSFTTLLRSNISCYMNKTLTQELMEQLTAQIVESIDYFINKSDEIS